jgi:phosphatidylserine/phosphatidylglycerophosphate/cardiolipin synthase-like enzyme
MEPIVTRRAKTPGGFGAAGARARPVGLAMKRLKGPGLPTRDGLTLQRSENLANPNPGGSRAMSKLIVFLSMIFILPISASANAQQRAASVAFYSAPEMNLVEIDKRIFDQLSAGSTVNLAAFVLSDYEIIDSLKFAASRGAKIRIYLDPRELAQLKLNENHPFVQLSRAPNVQIKVKAEAEGLMHMKSYAVDNSILRTGSANESFTGLTKQDNDLLLITDRAAVEAFNRKFEVMWARRSNVAFSFP